MAEPEDNEGELELMEMENGHMSSTEGSEIDRESSDETEVQPVNRSGEYDRDLPTAHGYLGTMNPLSGYSIFEDEAVLRIYALYTDTLVFPGFTLPLVITNHFEIRVMENFIKENNKVFVLLCANQIRSDLSEFGVTMEIFESSMGRNGLHIKAKGRQRCRRLGDTLVENVAGRIKIISVKIQAEPPIVTPLVDTQLLALKNKRGWSLNKEHSDLGKIRKYRRYHLAQYPFPNWVYDKNEVTYYTKILRNGLVLYHNDYLPTDPEKLSYWFVQNYQLCHEERLKILELNTTLQRLKLECIYLKLERNICCENCGIEITDPKYIFAMSKDGWMGNYVNPGGHVFETVTVYEAKNYQLVGAPSRQFSWFPGYAWTIMQCSHCNNHLGWKFRSDNLLPNEFFGLAKSGVKVIIPQKFTEPDLDELKQGSITYSDDYIGMYHSSLV